MQEATRNRCLGSADDNRGTVKGGDVVDVLIPVYNDWDSAKILIGGLGGAFRATGIRLRVLLVDDGSAEDIGGVPCSSVSAIDRVDVLSLRRNLGHQRAIAVGLCYLHADRQTTAVVVMDGDGEDRPEDAARLAQLLLSMEKKAIVFAERSRRSEGIAFQAFYALYRLMHYILTGYRVRFGNFSVLPGSSLERLVTNPDLWNHYVACILKMRVPYSVLPTMRGNRYRGDSHMNFPSLVLHGLGAIAVFAENVGVRLLLAAGIGAVLFVCMLFVVLFIRLMTTRAIVGWASSAGGLALVLLLQVMSAAFLIVLFILNARSSISLGPMSEYRHFIRQVDCVYRKCDLGAGDNQHLA